MTTATAPRELKSGVRVTFVENDESLSLGTINGTPWVYWTGSDVQARVPVACDDGRCLDVADFNIRSVS